jgi:hypothetical protein
VIEMAVKYSISSFYRFKNIMNEVVEEIVKVEFNEDRNIVSQIKFDLSNSETKGEDTEENAIHVVANLIAPPKFLCKIDSRIEFGEYGKNDYSGCNYMTSSIYSIYAYTEFCRKNVILFDNVKEFFFDISDEEYEAKTLERGEAKFEDVVYKYKSKEKEKNKRIKELMKDNNIWWSGYDTYINIKGKNVKFLHESLKLVRVEDED